MPCLGIFQKWHLLLTLAVLFTLMALPKMPQKSSGILTRMTKPQWLIPWPVDLRIVWNSKDSDSEDQPLVWPTHAHQGKSYTLCCLCLNWKRLTVMTLTTPQYGGSFLLRAVQSFQQKEKATSNPCDELKTIPWNGCWVNGRCCCMVGGVFSWWLHHHSI